MSLCALPRNNRLPVSLRADVFPGFCERRVSMHFEYVFGIPSETLDRTVASFALPYVAWQGFRPSAPTLVVDFG